MNNRVLGFSGIAIDYPVVFIHEDNEHNILVNGKRFEIRLEGPGKTYIAEDEFIIRVSTLERIDQGDFVSFSGGLILNCAKLEGQNRYFRVVNPGFLSVSSLYEEWPMIASGVLTVSDKGSRGERKDTSGPALEAALNSIGAVAVQRSVVPDEVSLITKTLSKWISSGEIHLILVTGGTGLSPRDVTPEALRSLGGRDVPGISEYMRWKTSFQNERSILSRSVAVASGKTLVISLPGSERGSVQCFNSIAPVIRHAVEILSGSCTDCGNKH